MRRVQLRTVLIQWTTSSWMMCSFALQPLFTGYLFCKLLIFLNVSNKFQHSESTNSSFDFGLTSFQFIHELDQRSLWFWQGDRFKRDDRTWKLDCTRFEKLSVKQAKQFPICFRDSWKCLCYTFLIKGAQLLHFKLFYMAYWPIFLWWLDIVWSRFFACLWTETESKSNI